MAKHKPTPDLDLWLFGADHVRCYRESNGDVGSIWNGVPCLILTTKGQDRSCSRHPAHLRSRRRCLRLIASHGGAPAHLQSYLNLCADPIVQVQTKADGFGAWARTAEGARSANGCDASWPRRGRDRTRTRRRTGRVIPVVVLERV
jgi:F420H(2)-dependent quinone reductase